MKKIIIIGRVPPPIGGVSTVVYRQFEFLREENEVFLFSGFSVPNLFNVISKIRRSDEIYIHSIGIILLLGLLLFSALKKTIVVDHNHMRKYNDKPLRKKIILWLLLRTSCIHLDSGHLLESYGENFKGKVSVVTPFYPPTKAELNKAIFPEEIESFIAKKKNIMVVSAWRLIFEDGIDLYGFDFSLQVLDNLQKDKKDVGIIFCIGDISYNNGYYHTLKEKVLSLGLKKHVIFWENCTNSWVLFREPMIYFRPTSTDGNSISILEAIHFRIPVVASDVVPRPKGVDIYHYGSIKEAKEKISNILK